MKLIDWFIVVVFILFIFNSVNVKGELSFQQKREKENSVKVIKNPKEPLYGEISLFLEEDLTIGNDKDENYSFFGGTKIQIDKKVIIDIWEKRLKKLRFSRSDVKKVIKFPRYKSFYSQILKDDKNRIYVREYKLDIDSENRTEYDLFNEGGHYLHKVKMSLPADIINKGYIYTIESDEHTGYNIVKRYKIQNWELIKEI